MYPFVFSRGYDVPGWREQRRRAPLSPSPHEAPATLSLTVESGQVVQEPSASAAMRGHAACSGLGHRWRPCLCFHSLSRNGFTWTLVAPQKLRVPAVTWGSLLLRPFPGLPGSHLWTELTSVLSPGVDGPRGRRKTPGSGSNSPGRHSHVMVLGRSLFPCDMGCGED